MRWLSRATVVGVLALASCNGDRDRDRASRDTTTMAPGPAPGMGMAPMDSAGPSPMRGRMSPRMRAHMDSMMGLSPEQRRMHMDSMMKMSPQQRQARMAEHHRMMTRMMDMMGSDTGMRMSADPAWRALTDSLRSDLAEMPKLEGEELTVRLEAHGRRVERLLAMQEQMMGN